MTNLKRLGSEIKERRLDFGFSQQKLADRAGVSRNTIIRAEEGLSLSSAVAKRLAVTLTLPQLASKTGLSKGRGKLHGKAQWPSAAELEAVARTETLRRAQIELPLPLPKVEEKAIEIEETRAETVEVVLRPRTQLDQFSLGSESYRILCRLAAGDISVDDAASALS